MIDLAEASRLFLLDPETGWITNRIKRVCNTVIGSRAGSFASDGYRQIKVARRPYPEHRIVWLLHTGRWPVGEVDHINGIRDDNRPCNLREATRAENCRNVSKHRDNRSGYLGVSWNQLAGKWYAQIRIDGRCKNLGYYSDPVAASEAYQAAAERVFGQFRRVA